MRVMPRMDMAANRTEMMLLHAGSFSDGDVLYMALPEGQAQYEGFSPIQFSDIPRRPTLLVADQIGYDQLFRSEE
jgi:hypothetical protein